MRKLTLCLGLGLTTLQPACGNAGDAGAAGGASVGGSAGSGGNLSGGTGGVSPGAGGGGALAGVGGALVTGGAPSGGAGGGGAASGGASGGDSSGGTAGGGAPTGGGGGDAAGGSSGAPSGGTGGGGGGTMGFVCPVGSDSLTPVLTGKSLSDPIAGVPEIMNNGGFFEGPVWFEGKLYLSQLDFSHPTNNADILVYTPGSGFATFVEDSATNGLALAPGNRLVGASQGSAGVISFDLRDPTAPPLDVARMYMGATFNSPNDVTVRSDGTVYFSDPNGNCDNCMNQPVLGVYRVPPGGSPELIVGAPTQPNGVILSPDETVLYVSGSSLVAFPVNADGSLGAAAPFGNNVSGTADGLGMDCAGNLYLAMYGQSSVIVLDPSGNQLPGSFSVDQPTNLAFGGPDNKTLFVTSFGDNRGQLRSVELEVPGFPN